MRISVIAIALLTAACGQPASPAAEPASQAPPDASASSTGVGNVGATSFTLESEALVGLWSFARHCGDYDLVFEADGDLHRNVVSPEGMATSYSGSWATADNNRVVLTLHRVGEHNARIGDDEIYHLDVASPVTDDLVARFARADGAEAQDITARRCPEEDRD